LSTKISILIIKLIINIIFLLTFARLLCKIIIFKKSFHNFIFLLYFYFVTEAYL